MHGLLVAVDEVETHPITIVTTVEGVTTESTMTIIHHLYDKKVYIHNLYGSQNSF